KMPLVTNAVGFMLFSLLKIQPQRKRMRSGDRPGLQNRRVAGHPVTGGFDSHSLPPSFEVCPCFLILLRDAHRKGGCRGRLGVADARARFRPYYVSDYVAGNDHLYAAIQLASGGCTVVG